MSAFLNYFRQSTKKTDAIPKELSILASEILKNHPIGQTDLWTDPDPALLDSLYVPTDQEIEVTKQNLNKLLTLSRFFSAQTRSDPSFLNGSPVDNKKICAQLDKLIHLNHCILSPIRFLPDEILQEILRYSIPEGDLNCIPPHVTPLAVAAYKPNAPRMRLYRVCRRWQLLLTSAPDIWSTVFIRLGGRTLEPQAVKYLQKTLSYSTPAPLKVTISNPGTRWVDEVYRESKLTELSPFFDVLRESSSRWHDLSVDNIPFLHHIHCLPGHPLPSLQRLKIGVPPWLPQDFNILDDLPDTPSLQAAEVHGDGSLRALEGLTSRNPQLTRVWLTRTYNDPFNTLQPIRALRNLTHLHLTFPVGSLEYHPKDSFTLPHLTTLSLSSKVEILDTIFQTLTCPNLTSLRIHCSHFLYGIKPAKWVSLRTQIINFIAKSGCTQINHLALTNFNTEQLRPLLSGFKNVEMLELTSACYISEQTENNICVQTLDSLRFERPSLSEEEGAWDPILPRLKRFDFSYCDADIYRYCETHHDPNEKFLDVKGLIQLCESRILSRQDQEKGIRDVPVTSLSELRFNLADHNPLSEEDMLLLTSLRYKAKDLGLDFRILFNFGDCAQALIKERQHRVDW
ncbi:hypothetical protein CC1G_08826 [Coprinopsis cinerea okayama7|uniref:Uncharacterized protein n=1 Tax=Coprinopsis cinerea (strain Okayama-7 / 130 / ATCC MYA-4618 / FGSC 9003) TaxID=240176 RepID=A8P682_COPC7|nr:hypothetical protein CC1G_08826 [Coprinopsis cinerea okayama7\|eukprot:XP_001839100.1 hypothetical protein CC1G_08826 [Coprinopsis cinerea okayama7\